MRLVDEIEYEATKLIRRHERYAKDLADEFRRRNRRSGANLIPVVHRPSYWQCASGFNPYLVRGRRERIAHSLRRALRAREFRARNAVVYEVPKGDGTLRSVSVFQVADAAVSKMVFKNLLQKNKPRLSAYSFAYRADLTVHDAIQHIGADIRGRPRIFVAEYDFSKYFDSIDHAHIWRTLEEQRFLVTDVERQVLESFLKTAAFEPGTYSEMGGEPRTRGVPQGTSISLFLANVAAWPLDRALERLGIGFARYADDTLVWSHDYARICDAVEAINEVASTMGAALNLKKSEGISILAPPNAPTEFKSKDHVDFVGYSFSSAGVGIRRSTQKRIQDHIAYLVYSNLVQEPKRGVVIPARFAPPVDRDYVVMVYQLRRYLYGDLSEVKLRKYLSRVVPRMHYRGVMAFYPLVDRIDVLEALDGWLLHTVATSLRARTNLLLQSGYQALPQPHGLAKPDLVSFLGRSSSGDVLDLRLPSFVRMGRLLHRASQVHGPNAIGHRRSNQYYLAI